MLDDCKRIFFFFWVIFLIIPNISNAISVKSYSYDKYGNVEEITNPRGFATQYHYDLLNRLEKIDYPDNKRVKYSYDLSGIRTKMEDHRGATLFEPDEFGKINKVTFPDGQSVSYRYDSEGNLIKLVYPDGTEVEYVYDLSNRLEAVKDASGVTKIEYDELSNALKKKTLPNGVTTEYQYHKTRKISNVIHKKVDGNLIEEFRYTYDENGNRTKIEKISPERDSHVVYIYDTLNRVVKAEYSDGFFESFSYDGAGNRRNKTTPQGVTIYEYDEENRLRKAGDTTYVYDLAGNLIEKSSPGHKSTYKYDFDNRLIFYSDESNQVAFEYDGDGNRVSKTVNGLRTDYINDLIAPVSQVLLKRVQGNWWKGEKTIHYVYGGSRISQSADGKTQFYLYDSIGRNVSALVGSSGKVLNNYEYDAFGGSLSEEQDIPNVYKYCGEQFDEETGLIFLRNRYYDPEIGRFISKDPSPGRLNHPATLNPYCYVENNPVNFVDPWGFEAIEPEELEFVGVFINGYPELFGGQGLGGHAGMWFFARKDTTPYFGNYPKRYTTDETANINAKTVVIGAYCNSQKVTKAIKAMQDIKWTASKNCVHTVLEGMKIMEFPHADKIRLGLIPVPFEFQSQMLKLHERDPVRPLSSPREEIKSPSLSAPSLGFNFSPTLDFGGVSLSKTAELQLSIADIAGAAFDSSTGQIILFGPKDRYLPPVDIDDLAVAIKSVYGIGAAPQDPGISMDFSSTSYEQMKVRYDGATANTSFGQTIFEADYLLKALAIGKNPATGQPFHLSVPGYSSCLDRALVHKCTGEQLDYISFWFVPDQITLVESEDHKGMVFSEVRMKVMSEAVLRGSAIEHPASREFAEHFTTYYDEYAKQLPVLQKLNNLGKITAIVKWLRENNIPFDTSFFANYQPKKVETVGYVNSIRSIYQWNSTQTERRHVPGHRHRRDVSVTYPHQITISGGVSYRLSDQNFTTQTHHGVNDFADLALKSRPSENDFSWSFSSPVNRDTFIAIAQSIHRTKKPGNVKKSFVDMSFSVPGNQHLSLERFYNSFSDKSSPIGLGWRITPYELEVPTEKIHASTQNGDEYTCYPMVLVRTPHREDFYELCMLNDDNLPIFKSPIDSSFLQDNLNGTFTLVLPQIGRIDFDSKGRLIKILDTNDFAIEYKYQDHRLVGICHQNGSEIALEYAGNRLVKASGPNNSIVLYDYHSNGQLAFVGDLNRTYLHYFYDPDKHLNKIVDHQENILFEAIYDDYNRAILVKEGAVSYQSDFSLEKKCMKTMDNQGNESIWQFDSKDRLIYKKDSSDNTWQFSYKQDQSHYPTQIIDPKGGITECHYDLSGNLIYFKNPVGAEWRFVFDDDGNLIGQKEPNERAVWNMYEKKNRLRQSFLKTTLTLEISNRFTYSKIGFKVDNKYNVFYSYDDQSGQLTGRTNTRGAKTSFTYDKLGQLKETVFPTGYAIDRKTNEKGNILEISDGFGLMRGYDYDETDRVKAVHTSLGTTHFTYNDGGDLQLIEDPNGFETSYHYDIQHNLKGVIDGEGGISAYEYNSLNQLTHISLPNGSCKTIEYDNSGRLTQEVWGK